MVEKLRWFWEEIGVYVLLLVIAVYLMGGR